MTTIVFVGGTPGVAGWNHPIQYIQHNNPGPHIHHKSIGYNALKCHTIPAILQYHLVKFDFKNK